MQHLLKHDENEMIVIECQYGSMWSKAELWTVQVDEDENIN